MYAVSKNVWLRDYINTHAHFLLYIIQSINIFIHWIFVTSRK